MLCDIDNPATAANSAHFTASTQDSVAIARVPLRAGAKRLQFEFRRSRWNPIFPAGHKVAIRAI